MDQQAFDRDLTKLLHFDSDVRAVCGRILETWRYNLAERKPGIAYVDENGQPITDLDLACAISALAERRAAINLPTYERRRPKQVREGEIVVSDKNRHGRIIGLSSNQDVFSFSVLVEDANVMTKDTVGLPRNFMLQDIDGYWHEGWHEIQFLPDELENEKLGPLAGTDGKVRFDNFIHPMRWTSFYGRPYLLAKIAITRLEFEIRVASAVVKALKQRMGIADEGDRTKSAQVVGESKEVIVPAFQAVVDGVDLLSTQSADDRTEGTLKEIDDVVSLLIIKETGYRDHLTEHSDYLARCRQLIRDLRFQTRATEFAFWHNAVMPRLETPGQAAEWLASLGNGIPAVEPRKPSWVADKRWEGYRPPKARTDWARMEIVPGLHLRWRVRPKTEHIAA